MRWLFSIFVMILISVWYYRNRRRANLLEFLYLLALAFTVFTPLSITNLNVSIMPPGTGRVSLMVDLWHFSVLENVILTVPLGMMIKRHYPHWSLLIVGLITGGGIECIQYVISHLWLLNRSSDINDVIANAAGVVIGGMMYYIYAKLAKK